MQTETFPYADKGYKQREMSSHSTDWRQLLRFRALWTETSGRYLLRCLESHGFQVDCDIYVFPADKNTKSSSNRRTTRNRDPDECSELLRHCVKS